MGKDKDLILVVHFSPLERYPPVMNAIRFFEKRGAGKRWKIFTTSQAVSDKPFSAKSMNVQINRIGWSGSGVGSFRRMFSYFWFNARVLFALIYDRPSAILYFESLSSFAPVLYKRIFNTAARIFVHYHEYVSPSEYEKGMKQLKYFHRQEQKTYHLYSWISQTNAQRMELFTSDNNISNLSILRLLPNYPPADWSAGVKDNGVEVSQPVRIVYVGSISMDTMYTSEILYWIKSLNGKASIDIYSFNADKATTEFVESLGCSFIRLLPAIDYYTLPDVLRQYEVGVILYKGIGENWVYNIPNKLFEYHVCGLDVWYPIEMISPGELLTNDEYPQIRQLDFSRLSEINLDEIRNRDRKKFRIQDFKCEAVLEELYRELVICNR